MSSTSHFHDYFEQAADVDELWQRLHIVLEDYGIAYVNYGITHIALPEHMSEHAPDTELTYFKSSFPEKMQVKSGERLSIAQDLGALHCLHSTTPRISSKTSIWLSPEERQLREETEAKAYQELRWYQESMRIGVTIPLRFGSYGKGGIAFQVGTLSSEEFDQVWGESRDTLIAIAQTFDHMARTQFDLFGFKLTKREKDVVFWLSQGHSLKMVADKLGTKAKTVENQVISARKKLNAANNVQLVSKALTLELI